MQEAVSLDALKTTFQVKGEHKGISHSPSERYDSMRLGFLACAPEHTTCFQKSKSEILRLEWLVHSWGDLNHISGFLRGHHSIPSAKQPTRPRKSGNSGSAEISARTLGQVPDDWQCNLHTIGKTQFLSLVAPLQKHQGSGFSWIGMYSIIFHFCPCPMSRPSWTPRQPEFPVTGVLGQGQKTMVLSHGQVQTWVSSEMFQGRYFLLRMFPASLEWKVWLTGMACEEILKKRNYRTEVQANCLSN